MKIATELHIPKWVSLPLVDAILRDDVLISFITPPEFQTEPLYPPYNLYTKILEILSIKFKQLLTQDKIVPCS